MLPGPPTLYQTLLADPRRAEHDLSSLRLGVTGAAVVPVELVQAMRDELGFDTVLTAYGLTESCGTVTMCRRSDPPEVIAATSGRAIPGLEVRAVVDGADGGAGEPGEIVVRGYTVMSGYWGNEAATAEAIDADGWLHTGDIGVLDAAGNVTITDRREGHVRRRAASTPTRPRSRPSCAATTGWARWPWSACPTSAWARWAAPMSCRRRRGGGADSPRSSARAILSWSREAMANYKVPAQRRPGRRAPGQRQREGAQARTPSAPRGRCGQCDHERVVRNERSN